MVNKLGFDSVETAKAMWWEHFQKYNQTLRSLRAGLGCEFDKVREGIGRAEPEDGDDSYIICVPNTHPARESIE